MFDDFDSDYDDDDRLSLDGDYEPVGASMEPDPDEDIGPVHPRANAELIGHDEIEARILNLALKHQLPQGIAFIGPKGIGKATFAYRLAKFLLANMDGSASEEAGLFGEELPKEIPQSLYLSPHNNVFQQVASGAYPDLKQIERDFDADKGRYKENLTVDQLRAIPEFLHMKSAHDGGWRVVLIDDADTMNMNAQNALLKILEEPPAKTLLLLVVHRPGAFLDTIWSRLQRYNMVPLNEPDMARMTDVNPLLKRMAADVRGLVLSLVRGRPGLVEQYALPERQKELIDLCGGLNNFFSAKSRSDVHKMADRYGGFGQEAIYSLLESFLPWYFESLLRVRYGTAEAKLKDMLENGLLQEMTEYFAECTPQTLLSFREYIVDCFRTVRVSSLDRRNAVLDIFLRLLDRKTVRNDELVSSL